MPAIGGESSAGALVPMVKAEPANAGEEPQQMGTAGVEATEMAVDRDMLCPICMQIIKDAFLTACGHSFCYMCISTHLKNKSDCPYCSHYLTTSHLYPNFLLNKVIHLLVALFSLFFSEYIYIHTYANHVMLWPVYMHERSRSRGKIYLYGFRTSDELTWTE